MNVEISPEKNPRMTQAALFQAALCMCIPTSVVQRLIQITQFFFIYSSIYYAKIFSLNHNASTECEKNYHAKFERSR